MSILLTVVVSLLVAAGVLLVILGIVSFFQKERSERTLADALNVKLDLPVPITLFAMGIACFIGAAIVGGTNQPPPASAPGTNGPTKSSTPTTSPTGAAAVTASSAPVVPGVAITSPGDGHAISVAEGAQIQGSATELTADESVWLLDHDPSGGIYYKVNEEPIPIRNGAWSFVDKPIGSKSDPVGTQYYVVAVKASKDCARTIQSTKPDATGAAVLVGLPAGCSASEPLRLIKQRD